VREQKLREALLDARVPDVPGAEERARRLVRAAYASSPPALRPRRRLRTRRALQVAVAVGLLAVAISPAGAAIGDWVGDRVGPAREPALPALTSLPAPGSLLVDSAKGPWVVGEDGGKRLLGEYRESAWSPHGLYIAVADEDELAAVDPLGEPRWTLSRQGPVRMPTWSPDGERIAYLSGGDIRLVIGDGTGDRLLDRGVTPVAPAWRWGGTRVLSYLTRAGRVRTLQTDTGRVVFEVPAPAGTRSIAWSANGERLLVVGRTRIEALDGSGRPAWAVDAPAGSEIAAAAISPGGDHAATILVSASGGRSELAILGPGGGGGALFEGLGRFEDVTYSPDGEWLLLAWRSADEWLFLSPGHPRRVVAVSGIAAQFDPGTTSPPSFPSVAGWCCPPTG
jgi:WD40-like Beta Propeller Repeat